MLFCLVQRNFIQNHFLGSLEMMSPNLSMTISVSANKLNRTDQRLNKEWLLSIKNQGWNLKIEIWNWNLKSGVIKVLSFDHHGNVIDWLRIWLKWKHIALSIFKNSVPVSMGCIVYSFNFTSLFWWKKNEVNALGYCSHAVYCVIVELGEVREKNANNNTRSISFPYWPFHTLGIWYKPNLHTNGHNSCNSLKWWAHTLAWLHLWVLTISSTGLIREWCRYACLLSTQSASVRSCLSICFSLQR